MQQVRQRQTLAEPMLFLCPFRNGRERDTAACAHSFWRARFPACREPYRWSSYARLRLRPLQWSRRKALKFGTRDLASMSISPALVNLSFDWLLALSPASTRTTICLPSSSIEGTAVQDTSACDVDSCLSIYIASCASDFIGHSVRDGIVPTYTCLLSRQQNGLTGSVFPDD